MDTLSPSAEQAAQRKEELEELAAGINKLAEHQQELADRLQQDQQHVAETQKEVAEQTVESQHILDTLRPQPEGESVS
jgi:ABC-type transporter Mla subunit MlaD